MILKNKNIKKKQLAEYVKENLKIDSLYHIKYYASQRKLNIDTFVGLHFLDNNLCLFYDFDYTKLISNIVEEEYIELFNDTIYIKIEVAPFDKSKHTYSFDEDDDDLLIKIDNKPFYGTDGGRPREYFSKIILRINKKNIYIKKELLYPLKIAWQNTKF